MKFGIEATYCGKTAWCTDRGMRMEFDSAEAANNELKDWKAKAFLFRQARYVVREIIG